MKKIYINNIIKCIFSFFLSFFIFCLVVLIGVFGVSTPDYAKYVVEKSGYVENSIKEIETSLSSIAIPGGFPEDFFEYGIGKETFVYNIYPFIDTVYQNKTYKADTSAFDKEVKDKLLGYLKENYPSYTKEIEENVLTMADMCVKEYMTYATPRSIRYIGNYISKITPIAKYGIFGVLAFIIVSLLVLLVYKAKPKYYLLGGFSSALMLMVAPSAFLLFGGLENIAITSKALFGFLNLFIKNVLYFLIISGLIIFILTLIFALVLYLKGKRNFF